MGMVFSNIHIRKSDTATVETVKDALVQMMRAGGYTLSASSEDCDIMHICTSDADWVSVYSDSFSFDSPQDTSAVILPLSEALRSDVLAVSCFDSDYLFLHLVNAADRTDAWANVGRRPDGPMPRRSNLAAWRGKVADHALFKAGIRADHVFAEEVFERIEPALGLPFEQACLSDDPIISPDGSFALETLYFRPPADALNAEEPQLVIEYYSLMQCVIGKEELVTALNRGGASRGLSVAFTGGYVENDEITFENVQLEYDFDSDLRKIIPLTMEKRRLNDGSYAYWCDIPDFKLPPKADGNLGWKRKMDLEYKRSFGIRFTPVGNPELAKDITVTFVPMKATPGNGQCTWNAVKHYCTQLEIEEMKALLRELGVPEA